MEYIAPRKADNDQMIKILERMISVKVDGIIIQGIGGQQFIDIIHKGNSRGIPIITIDADVENSERKAYVGIDNYHAGQLAGKSIIDNTTGNQYVGVVIGRFNTISQQERIRGFKDKVKDIDRIHIVDIKESNITQTGAAQATYSLLREYPSISTIVGMSALDGVGIVEGLQEIAPNKDVFITAFDTLPETLALIQDLSLIHISEPTRRRD